jgi:hypothetical protein
MTVNAAAGVTSQRERNNLLKEKVFALIAAMCAALPWAPTQRLTTIQRK